jgi:kynureninase
MLCSSPSILAIAALEAGLQVWLGVDLDMLQAKAGQLGDVFIALVEQGCGALGVRLASPRDAAERGAQVSFAHADAYPVMQALIARGVIGDFRAPDLIRFGFAPMTTRFVDVFDAAATLSDVLASGDYRQPAYAVRAAVT